MKNISSIAYIFPSFEIYGAQQVALDYLKRFESLGYKITIFSGGEGALSKQIESTSIIYFYKKKTKFNRLWRLLKGSFLLLKRLREKEYDLIISFAPFHNRLICLFKLLKLINSKVMIEDHAYPPKSNSQEFSNPIVLFLVQQTEFLYNSANLLKVLTTECELYYRKKLSSVNIFAYQNLMNFHRIDQLLTNETHHVYPKNKSRLIFLGRLVDQKNLFFLIKAFSYIREQVDCELMIVGDGPLKKNLEENVKKQDIKDINFISSSKFNYSLIQSSDLFVICSKWEGLVLTIFEAMYLRTLIVSTSFEAGLNYQIGNNQERGYITPSSDIKKYTSKIIEVLNNLNSKEVNEKKLNAYKFVSNNCNIHENFNHYHDKLMECLQ